MSNENEELNLTPFIDLFSTLVVFLLLTAVWNQISSLSTNIENSTSSDTPPPKVKEVQLSVTLLENEIQMLEDKKLTRFRYSRGLDKDNNPIKKVNSDRMVQILRYWKQKYPNKKGITLNTQNNVSYGNMIEAFDTMVGQDFPEVGVNTQ